MTGQCALEDVILTASSRLARRARDARAARAWRRLSRVQHAGLINAFSQLLEPLDVLLVDTAAGLSDGVITFSEAAQHVVVLVCDEPASLTDAYGLIKVLCRRQPSDAFEIVANMVDGAGARARAVREARRASANASSGSRRRISATCRRTTTCARRYDAKRPSSKRFRAALGARVPPPGPRGRRLERRRRRAAASSFSWSGSSARTARAVGVQ